MADRKVRVMAICPDFNDATSFYRGAWPLSRMMKEDPHFEVVFQPSGDNAPCGWAELSLFDILFIQRAYTPWNLDLMTAAKESGLKTWIDYDDDLFQVPFQNRAHKVYADPKTKDVIARMVEVADLVTFSTVELKRAMACGRTNGHVVRNATDFDLLEIQGVASKSKVLEKTIFWRGSATHDHDLFLFAEEFKKISQEFHDWRFVFLGTPWPGITHYIPAKQMIIVPPVRLPEYIGFVRSLKPIISIVPLEDCPFNRSKSNIAWQEATFSGAVCVVPDWEEWRVAGAVRYKSPHDFGSKLKNVILNKAYREQQARKSLETLETCYDLRDTVQDRLELVRALC